jgi:hypothetical protein
MRIYTVHHRTTEPSGVLEQCEAAEFVKEGFSWPAFLLGELWLLFQRMWVVAILFLAARVAAGAAVQAAGLPGTAAVALWLGMHLFLGFEGYDLYRWTLARRGLAMIGIVSGADLAAAERRFFERLIGEAKSRARPPAPFAPSGFLVPAAESGPLGLFPQP